MWRIFFENPLSQQFALVGKEALREFCGEGTRRVVWLGEEAVWLRGNWPKLD